MKTGLIIQGPILSPGYGPYEFDGAGNYVKSWIEYDATIDIAESVSEASMLFDYIVVSTWNSEHATRLLSKLEGNEKVIVVWNSEDSFLTDKRKSGTHKYHQIFSLLTGIRALRDLECDVFVKLRTDQRLDMSNLYKAATQHSKKNPTSLGVPYMNLFEIDRLADFYWVGNTKIMERLCVSYLETPEIYVDGHMDYFYKFSKVLKGDNLSKDIPLNSAGISRVLPECYVIWTTLFYPLPKNLFGESWWRGKKINASLNSWIRWHKLINCPNSDRAVIGTLGNIVVIKFTRLVKRPFIPLSSAIKFKIFRKISASRLIGYGNKCL